MDTQQAMDYMDKLEEERRDEVNARFDEIFGGKTVEDMFRHLYFKIDPSKLSEAERADFYRVVYNATKSQLPMLFGGIDEHTD